MLKLKREIMYKFLVVHWKNYSSNNDKYIRTWGRVCKTKSIISAVNKAIPSIKDRIESNII